MNRTVIVTEKTQAQVAAEQPDVVQLSVCIIALKGNTQWINKAIGSAPRGAEVIVLWNERGEVEKDVTHMKDEFVEGRTIRFYEMTYTEEYKSFAELRNLCIALASRDWILYLDADEEIVAINADFFDKFNDTYPAGIGGLMCGVYGIAPPQLPRERASRYMSDQVRVFRNHCGFYFHGHCHEQIMYSIEDRGFTVMDCSLLIHHRGYRVAAETMQAKMLRNVKLLSRQVAEETDIQKLRFQLTLLLRDGDTLQKLTEGTK
jgi:hypothetical protein